MSRNEDGEERFLAPPHGRFWWLFLLEPYVSVGDAGEGFADLHLEVLILQADGPVLHPIWCHIHVGLSLLAQEVERGHRVDLDQFGRELRLEDLREEFLQDVVTLASKQQEEQSRCSDDDRIDNRSPDQHVTETERRHVGVFLEQNQVAEHYP